MWAYTHDYSVTPTEYNFGEMIHEMEKEERGKSPSVRLSREKGGLN